MDNLINLGVMTEEAGVDVPTAIRNVRELGLEYLEVGSFGERKISDLSDREINDLKVGLDDNGISVSCVSPNIFFNLPLWAARNEPSRYGSYDGHIEDLKRSIEIAHRLGTRNVRVFGFKTETLLDPPLTGDHWPRLVEKFLEPVELAENEDVVLAIETCFFNIIGNSTTARRLMDDVKSPNLKVLWDICNCLYSGETVFPDAFDLIADDIVHIHLKDGHPDPAAMTFRMCPLGDGEVKKYPDILVGLQERNYSGGMSLECEYIPPGGTLVDALHESLACFDTIVKTAGLDRLSRAKNN